VSFIVLALLDQRLMRTGGPGSAQELQTTAEAELSGPGSAVQRLTAYLTRERDVLRGCRIGRLAADPDVVATPAARAPLEQTFAWLEGRLAEVVAEGQAAGELDRTQDPAELGATLVAVVQGGYVMARAADEPAPFERTIHGALALLATVGA